MEGNLSQLKDFLSQLGSFKGDLSNITAPPFVLAPKSAIEVPTCWASRQSIFLAPTTEEESPEKRVLLATQNFLCSLSQLVDLGGESEGKKPFNPFLGEIFLGVWGDEEKGANGVVNGDGGENGEQHEEKEDGKRKVLKSGETCFIAEQVSHHPPVTACFAFNKTKGISSAGFAAQETSFSATSGVTVKQVGYAVVTDYVHDEQHIMTLPSIQVRGLATGQTYPELDGPCWISSSSGYLTKIEFEGKGKLGMGTKNRVTAEICQVDESGKANLGKPLYKISGQWSGEMTIEGIQNKSSTPFHINDFPISTFHVDPLSRQTAWESRKAWSPVVQGIREGDMTKISEHKTTIEEEQRQRRKIEKEQGRSWETLFFQRKEADDDVVRTLLARIPGDEVWRGDDLERTAGIWKNVGMDETERLIGMLK